MKDKQVRQIEAKNKHKERLKEKRRTQPTLERKVPTQTEKPTILIVCEGKNTEPSYFRQFKLSSATIIPIGEGYNTTALVNRAIELNKEYHYDQAWCVFDADPKPDNPNQASNYNKAIWLAKKENFGIACSNQAFEYWIILHFLDHQGGKMNRRDYDKKINSLLKPFGLTYDGKGSKIITEELFNLLEAVDPKANTKRQQLAIERAERNYKKLDHSNPSKAESCTAVYLLVQELLKYL